MLCEYIMKKQASLQGTFKKSFRFATLCALVAVAEVGSARNSCGENVAVSTVYFVPHVLDYCSSPKPCAAFKRAVRMQGSGTLPGNKVLKYTGKTEDLGSCETAFGASGNCLIPYISVAADPRYYSMGDIIEMPAYKGKKITLPNGISFIHPGFFIVQDTGGAIKGKNRFDFFTGSLGMNNIMNVFGTRGPDDMRLADKTECSSHKKFDVVRRGSSQYSMSLAAIESVVNDMYSSSSKVMVASANSGAR